MPHPYFDVKSPEFYKKQKAQFELSKSKFKLVNSIRSGQEQELLQKQIEEVKRKQKALNELTKLQETLEFQLDDQNPRVYGDKTPVGRPAEAEVEAPVEAEAPVGRPVEAEAKAEEPIRLEDMNLGKLRTNFRDEFGEFLTGKSAWVNKLSVDKIRRETSKLRNLPRGERGVYIAGLKQASKTSGNSPQRRPVPISAEEFKKGKSGLKKGVARKQKPKQATKKPLSLMEQIQQSAPFLERARSQAEEETEGFGLKTKKKTRGKGISKKQKKVLLYGSAVAGNNNSKLLDTIMKI